MKLVLSLSSIAVILLVSSFISIMEYSRMSSYVSDLIAANIGSINAAQKLADAANSYNLGILAIIGDNSESICRNSDRTTSLTIATASRPH